MGDSAGGDDVNKKTEKENEVKVKKIGELNKDPEENIFQHFHNKYLQLTSITTNDGKEKSENHDQTKLIIESMITKLNNGIKDINVEHKNFMRYLGMKVFLSHLLSKCVDETTAISLLENMYDEAKPYFANPEVTYSGFLIMNSLSSLMQKKDCLEKIKDILENCQAVYKTMKLTNKEDNYFSGKELFAPDIKMDSNKEARLKFEKIVITNLLFLGSIYEKLGNHYKDIVCYHTAFSRMLNKGLVSPFKWVDFTTRLACVFIDDNNFKDARHHLSAATHVHEILEGKNKLTNDTVIKDLLKNNAIHLALAWVRYCVLLFEKSKDEDRTKFIILYKNGYFFSSCKQSQIEMSNFNEHYEDLLLNERNIGFQNQRFIDTIDKELVEDDHDKFDEYNDIIREKQNIGFGDVFHSIGESCKMSSPGKGKEKTLVDVKFANDYESTSSEVSRNSKEKESESIKTYSEDSSNKQFMQDETDIETTQDEVSEGIQENTPEEESSEKMENDGKEFNLVFSSLGYLPIEHTVTKDLIQNPEEARKLFSFACRWSNQAKAFYPSNTDFYSHVHVMLNMVSLYRLCAYFQGRDNLDYRISLEQTRENLLEQLLTELTETQPESHLHVRLYQEMALLNIDLAMLNMCNIYNIRADDTYKLCALAEIQSHINHTYIVGDMLEKSTEIIDQEQGNKEQSTEEQENTPVHKPQVK